MNFNKKHFSIDNGKKILHKSRGRWITITASMLLALGIAGVSTVSASANDDSPSVVAQTSDQNNIDQQAKTYLQNNAAYDKSSFKNDLNNSNDNKFLTPNTWYRPKMIHRNGTQWIPSQPNDYRPILMDWAPDQQAQRNYLNYMHQNGFLDSVPGDSASKNDLLHGYDQVQDKLENKITQSGNTDWLHSLISNFVSQQPQWNKNSEHPGSDGLQGGYFAYQNSPLTPDANSSHYRLLGRDPNGGSADNNWRFYNPDNGNTELLLGNDIDNSNPTVQAEDLNNLYYFTSLGNIFGKGPKANFDGIRIDGTYSMDYDTNKLYAQFMNDRYHDPNNHLVYLEDGPSGSIDGANLIHNSALTQDSMLNWPSIFDGKNSFNFGYLRYVSNSYAHRDHDYTENQAIPNYMLIGHHDLDTIVNTIGSITNQTAEANGNDPSRMFAAAEVADKKYDDDEFNVYKHYNQEYGIPARYALMLSDKDTVPVIYYGDMYKTYEPYMSTPSPYFGAIQRLLEARKKYVAGGQEITKYDPQYHIISSVRFGMDPNFHDVYGGHQILNRNDDSKSNYHDDPTTGMAVIINNDENYHPSNGISVFMGAAHKHQTYMPLIKSTTASDGGNGMIFNDSERLTTDGSGNLHIPAADITGTTSPQMLGNLSVWVPVGAPNNQDAREFNYPNPSDGKVYHSNAGLDSHVAMESFSSYMPFTNDDSERLDNVIANKTNKLQDWGITDFRFPPHYKSVNDPSFSDGFQQNGYAFEDRYNLGNNQPTKYGTLNDLLNANIALHNAHINTEGDFVSNQLYDLPNSQVVSVNRSNSKGEYEPSSGIHNDLYDSKTVSSPSDLQYKYGGAFLKELQSNPKYHNLFTENQISTGVPINPTPIKQWSAKYMNGTNIQGRGAGYILHQNDNNNTPSYSDYYLIGNKIPKVFNLNYHINNESLNANDQMAKENPQLINNTYVQNYHYNTPEGTSNAIQSIVPHYNGNKVDYYDGYYLWSPNGSLFNHQWYHFRTNDFSKINAYDSSNPVSLNNVAIPDPTISNNGNNNVEVASNNNYIPWGYVASGSIIQNNSKPNGQSWLHQDQWGNHINDDAKLAYFSTLDGDDKTSNNGTYLAYSNNDQQFHPYSSNDVFDATSVGLPSSSDFRDPFVKVNGNKLIAYIAGGVSKKIYVMTSNDGIHWNHNNNDDIDLSHINIPNVDNNSNIIETPNVQDLNGTPILFFSCQDNSNKSIEHVFYATGHYDSNGIFKLDANTKYGSTDNGFDNYAGNFTKIDNNNLVYIGWPLNWNSFYGQHMGYFTLPRVISWDSVNHDINVTPIEPGSEHKISSNVVDKNATLNVNSNNKITLNFNSPTNQFNIDLNRTSNNHIPNNILFKFNNGSLTIDRQDDNHNKALDLSRTIPNIGEDNVSSVDLYIDNDILEMYIPEIHKIYTFSDLTPNRNAPYKLSVDQPCNINNYTFDLIQRPTVNNLSLLISNVNDIKNKVSNVSKYANDSNLMSAKQSINLINGYFNTINNAINIANNDETKYNGYSLSGDARQYIFGTLINDEENIIKTKLYQTNIQLDNLYNISKMNKQITINYVDNLNHIINSQNISGRLGSRYTGDFNIPFNYRLITSIPDIIFNNQDSVINVKVSKNPVPIFVNTINYVDDQNHSVGTQKISGHPNSKYTGSLMVPSGYHLSNSNLTITLGLNNSMINVGVKVNQAQNNNANVTSSSQDVLVAPTPKNNSKPNVPVTSSQNQNNNANATSSSQDVLVAPTPKNNSKPSVPVTPSQNQNNNSMSSPQAPVIPIPNIQSSVPVASNNNVNTPNISQPSVSTNPMPNNTITSTNIAPTPKITMNHKVNQIALKHEYKAKMNGKHYVTLPKGYSMKVANTVRQYGKDVYVAKFNRKNVWIPASVAKITGYAVTNKATSYPRWININDRNTGIRKNSNGRIVKNLRHNTLRVLGLTYNNRGQEFYAVRYNGHRVYITTSPKYVYKTYLQTDRRNFKVYIKHPTLVHVSQRFTAKHHLHVINAGRYVRVRKVVRDNDYRTRFYISAHKYVTGNKYYVRFAN